MPLGVHPQLLGQNHPLNVNALSVACDAVVIYGESVLILFSASSREQNGQSLMVNGQWK